MIPAEVSYFNWVDILAIVLTLIFVIFGYIRGFVKEFLSLFSWGTSVTASLFLYPYVSDLFINLIRVPIVRSAVGFILTFVVILMLFLVSTSMISEKVAQTCFSDINKAIGGVFGIVKSCVVLICLCLLVIVFAPQGECMNAINNAKIGVIFKETAINVCSSIKELCHSPQFKEFFDSYGASFTNKKFDAEKVAKDLSIPKISKIVYQKDDPAKTKEQMRKEYREDFMRKQAVIGPTNNLGEESAKKVSDQQKKHRELIANLQEGLGNAKNSGLD